MAEESHVCPKCSSEMTEGSAVGHAARPALWLAIKINELLDERWLGGYPDGLERYFITSYRCAGCGYLEQFAKQRHYDAL